MGWDAAGLGNTPLHVAAASGHGEAIDVLIGAGAELNARRYAQDAAAFGRTPLHEACEVRSPLPPL